LTANAQILRIFVVRKPAGNTEFLAIKKKTSA
jgi:hypothetical protein